MKKILSFLLLGFLLSIGYAWGEDVTIASGTFNGKNSTYTTGWSTTGTGKSRTDCIIIGSGENITSPAVDLSGYSKVTISINARRYGTLSGSKATIDASIGGVSQGTVDATGTSATTALTDIKFTPTASMTAAVFVFTCTNATSAGSTHGAGINSITIVGTKNSTPQPTTYSVTYDANGATSGSVPTDETAYDANAEVTVLGNTGNLAKTGYTFAGWNVNAEGTGADFSGTFTITQDTTLYAKWTAKTITGLSYTGTPSKTAYYAGENFASAGLTVTATFSDDSQEDVTTSVNWTPSPLTKGTTSVTGTYMGQTINVPGLTVTAAPGSAELPYTVAQAIAAIDAAGKTTINDKYVAGIVSQVDSYNSKYNSITYWISDDGTTTDQFEVYGGLGISGGSAFSSLNDVQVGDVVVVSGNITYYSNNQVYEFQSNNHLVSLKLVAPTFYPVAGAVASNTALTISDLHTDATIYYTTDGNDPTASSTAYDANNKPTITAATTFKAIAVKNGYTTSDVATAAYTVLAPAATPEFQPAAGTYTSVQNVTISTDTEGATIYYTTNGDNPTTSSTEYTAAITVGESMTIKAIAVKEGMANSAVTVAEYTINLPGITLDKKSINATAEETDGTITVTYNNMTDILAEVLFVESDGETEATYDWLDAEINSTDNTKLDYTIGANTGAARTAYMKVYAIGNEGDAYSELITISQAEYVAPIDPAVAGQGAFVKVTDDDDLTNGVYLIVYEGNATHDAVAFNGSLSTVDAASNGIKVNIVNGKIESNAATAAATFEIRPTSGTILSKSGYYIGASSYANGISASEEASDFTNAFNIDENENAVIKMSFKGGDVTIRYNYAVDQLRFRYYKSGQQAVALYKYDATEAPFAAVKLNSEGYATYASSYPIDFTNASGFSAWQATNANTSTGVISFSQIEGAVAAGTGILLQGTASTIVSVPVVATGTDISSTNKLVGCATAKAIEAGTENKANFYVLSGNEFQSLSSWTGTIPAGKAYLDLTGVSLAPGALRIVFEENNTTDIKAIEASEGAVKFFDNGNLYILREGVVYDAMGKMVR